MQLAEKPEQVRGFPWLELLPAIANLELVEVLVFDQTAMLQLADDDAGGNAGLSSKKKYRSSVASHFG